MPPNPEPDVKPSKSQLQNHSNPKSVPLWRDCKDRSRVEIVQINEEAARHSETYLESVVGVLKDFDSAVPLCLERIQEIIAIRERKQAHRFFIGFLGPSGSGKSSLINALLRIHLLPRSEESASTAVPVEVTWNDDLDPEKAYRAEIEGLPLADFQRELETLFEDYASSLASPDGEDDEIDIEMHQRMTQTFSKLKVIIPEWKAIDVLKSSSVKEILELPQVARVLSEKIELIDGNLDNFVDMIKDYIEASKPTSGSKRTPSFWPLVKVVRLYIKADILKHGMALVDLPGTQDVSAARSAVAEDYRKNLNMACVTVRATRAATDKGGQELLTAPVQLNLQFDGLVSSQSLCYIITQCDVLENWEKYIKDHPNLRPELQDDIDLFHSTCQELRDILGQIAKQTKLMDRELDNLGKLEREEERLKSQVDKILAPVARKRKRESEEGDERDPSVKTEKDQKKLDRLQEVTPLIPKTQTRINGLNKDLASLHATKDKLYQDQRMALYRLKKVCIANRAQLQSAAIRSDYEAQRKLMGKVGPEKPLEVISVSANSFAQLSDGDRDTAILRGFLTRKDTGIPILRDKLLATTWETRQESARSFNEEAEMNLNRLRVWAIDTTAEYKMNSDSRQTLDLKIDDAFKSLQKKIETIHWNLVTDIRKVFENEFLSKVPDVSNTAARKAVHQVQKWSTLNWATHRSVNRAYGCRVDSTSKAHNWPDDLVRLFKILLLRYWVAAVQEKIPRLRARYEKFMARYIVEFADAIVSTGGDIHDEVHRALHLARHNITVKGLTLNTRSHQLFEKINVDSKNAHRLILREVEQSWNDVFEACGKEIGRGHFQRNKARHNDKIKKDGLAMYQRAAATLKNRLNRICNGLPVILANNLKMTTDLIREEINVTLDRHTAPGERVSERRGKSLEKEKLRDRLLPIFDQLEKAWGMEPMKIKNEDDEEVSADLIPEDDDDEYMTVDDLIKRG